MTTLDPPIAFAYAVDRIRGRLVLNAIAGRRCTLPRACRRPERWIELGPHSDRGVCRATSFACVDFDALGLSWLATATGSSMLATRQNRPIADVDRDLAHRWLSLASSRGFITSRIDADATAVQRRIGLLSHEPRELIVPRRKAPTERGRSSRLSPSRPLFETNRCSRRRWRRSIGLDGAVHNSISDILTRNAPSSANVCIDQALLAGGASADREPADAQAHAQIEKGRRAGSTLALKNPLTLKSPSASVDDIPLPLGLTITLPLTARLLRLRPTKSGPQCRA